ncbi:MAG: cytochrome c3 family protein [Sulfurimonas sp.]|nr:cytochrome c3 family protein [Sulfurimonas sp.]
MLFVVLNGNAKEPATSSIKVLHPLDKVRFSGENCTLVIETDPKRVDKIVITLDNNDTYAVEVMSNKKTYCKTIKLHTAQDKVSITCYKDSKLIETTKKDFYFLSELFEGIDEDSVEEYKSEYFHTKENEDKCKSCHDMTSNIPKNNKPFEDVTETTCYSCHQGMLKTKNTHAPVSNWLCTECHNGKPGEYNMDDGGASKYLAPDPIAETCGNCHDDVDTWQASKYGHGAVNDGRCERCHNPHGSDNEFFLRKPIWELCVTCHAEKADGKHVISSIGFGQTTTGGHPTKNRKDPARPGRDLTCTSCHNPHGSRGTMLLRMKGSLPFSVCSRCHKK